MLSKGACTKDVHSKGVRGVSGLLDSFYPEVKSYLPQSKSPRVEILFSILLV